MTNKQNQMVCEEEDQNETRTDFLNELRKQIEFYFSDENLIFDGFLLNKIWSHKHQFVSLRNFLKFQKVKRIFNLYNRDKLLGIQKIQDLAQAIQNSNYVKVNKCLTMVRRIEDAPKNKKELVYLREKIMNRCLVVAYQQGKITKENFMKNFKLENQCKAIFSLKSTYFHDPVFILFFKKEVQKTKFQNQRDDELDNINIFRRMEYDEYVKIQSDSQRSHQLNQNEKSKGDEYNFVLLKIKDHQQLRQKKKNLRKDIRIIFSNYGIQLKYINLSHFNHEFQIFLRLDEENMAKLEVKQKKIENEYMCIIQDVEHSVKKELKKEALEDKEKIQKKFFKRKN